MKQQDSEKKVTTDSPLSLQDDMLLSMIPKEELIKLALRINTYLEKEHKVSKEQLYGPSGVLSVPISIFSKVLSPLEALVKFLKEQHDMTYHEIGMTIGRDERGIWVTYRNASKKMKQPFSIPEKDVFVPISIFTKKLSILESLVRYLRDEKGMKGSEIASALNKSTSTIWTVYNRAKDKSK
ncbi:MAG: hypothetical protein KJ574_02060 [Nanoarchaeota archaeon]|nr:hypothetical protein [Nanoarchaeota archaeon]